MKSKPNTPKKTEKRKKGDIGEQVACQYLEKRGYKVLERNYWKPWGEIDVVAETPEFISFVEVKTVSLGARQVSRESNPGVTPTLSSQRDRREPSPYSPGVRPEENFHPAKLKRLYRAIQTYLLDHKVPESREWRIDLACVYLDFSTHKARVELIENVIL